MLIVISGFTCLYKCIFLIICNFSSFSVRNGGKYVLCCFLQQKKLICQILSSKLASSPVDHGLIRALLSLALLIFCNFYMFFTFVLVQVSVFVWLLVLKCMFVQLPVDYCNLNVCLRDLLTMRVHNFLNLIFLATRVED